MKLLEKDIHEKQDTIVSLRRQLEDIKQINLEMYNKLQVGISHTNCATSTHFDPDICNFISFTPFISNDFVPFLLVNLIDSLATLG